MRVSFFFSPSSFLCAERKQGKVKNRTGGQANEKKKLSRSTAVSVQTAQAERGAKKVQMNNKNKTSNKQK
jgi:hypothetical protein